MSDYIDHASKSKAFQLVVNPLLILWVKALKMEQHFRDYQININFKKKVEDIIVRN